jgi:hypothetical protein
MKPLYIGRVGEITSGALKGFAGKVVAFDSEVDEALIKLDDNTFVNIKSEMILQNSKITTKEEEISREL